MDNIFKKYNFVSIKLDTIEIDPIIIKTMDDINVCYLSISEKEKIIKNLVKENKEKINIRVEITDQYFLIEKFFQLISKFKEIIKNK